MRRLILLALAAAACESGPPLAAPTNLTAAPLGAGVHLTWKDNSPDEAEFQVERRTQSGSFSRLGAVTFDITQYHDEPVTAGETYVYRVRAVAGGRASPYSNEATVTLGGGGGHDGGHDGHETDAGGTPDGGATTVSFRQDIVPLFRQSCGATNSACHGREAYGAAAAMGCRGWLALEDAPLGARFYAGPKVGQATGCPDRTLHERLTQLDAWMCEPGRRYVQPGSTARSQIFQAAAGDPSGSGTCNKQPGVPLGRMPPPPAVALSAAEVQKLSSWILAGAPNN